MSPTPRPPEHSTPTHERRSSARDHARAVDKRRAISVGVACRWGHRPAATPAPQTAGRWRPRPRSPSRRAHPDPGLGPPLAGQHRNRRSQDDRQGFVHVAHLLAYSARTTRLEPDPLCPAVRGRRRSRETPPVSSRPPDAPRRVSRRPGGYARSPAEHRRRLVPTLRRRAASVDAVTPTAGTAPSRGSVAGRTRFPRRRIARTDRRAPVLSGPQTLPWWLAAVRPGAKLDGRIFSPTGAAWRWTFPPIANPASR